MFFLFVAWWLAVIGTYSSAWPRAFDDWKNGLFYVGAGCLVLWTLRQPPLRSSAGTKKILFLFFLYLLVALLSLTGPGPNYEGLLSWAEMFLWGGLAWSLSLWPRKQLWDLGRFSVTAAVVVSGLVWSEVIRGQTQAFIPPVGHISYLGTFLALHLPLAGYLFWVSKSRERFAWFLCWLMILSALCLTGTRAAIVAFAVAIAVFLLSACVSRIMSPKKVAAVIILTAIPMLLLHWIQPTGLRGVSWESRFSQLANFRTMEDLKNLSSNRLSDYRATLTLVQEQPWRGWGLGSFRFVYPTVSHSVSGTDPVTAGQWFMHPHNEFLNQAAELGLFGAMAFATLWGSFFVLGFRHFRSATDPARRELLICGAGIISALVAWQFDTSFLFPLIRLLVALYVAIFLNLIRSEPVGESIAINRIGRWFLMTLTCGTLTITTLEFASLYAVQKCQMPPDFETGKIWAERAYRMAPYSFNSMFVKVSFQLGDRITSESASIVDRFEKTYPYVPGVLYQTAQFRLLQGETRTAEDLLERALFYDPGFAVARNLLTDIKKEPRTP